MIEQAANPFLFVCGVPRSGTTLLQRMLNAHPELAVANDTHFIPRSLEITDRTLVALAESGKSIDLTDRLLANVSSYHRFARLGLTDGEFQAACNGSTTFQELVSALYSAFATKQGKRLGGEKTPDYLRRLTLLHGLFQKSKILHLVRDGRNVALSLMEWATPTKGPGKLSLWNESPLGVCALWWKWLVIEAHRQSLALPGCSFKRLRYESLVEHPEGELESVCKFLGLEYQDEMLRYHQGKVKRSTSLSAKSAWLGPQQGLRDWRISMPRQHIELFEILSGDALELYGYQLSGFEASEHTREQSRQCQDWWEKNFLPKFGSLGNSKHDAMAQGASAERPQWELGRVN